MAEDFTIILSGVKNDTDVETIRSHRNACREFMTRNTEYITSAQQANWYKKLDKEYNKLFILYKMHHGAVLEDIGYGYIRVENDEVLLTGGVTSSERGNGYGYILFSRLVMNSLKYGLPIRLEVLKTNAAGIATYKKADFTIIDEDETIYKMEYNL